MISIFILVLLLFLVPALTGYLFRNIDQNTRSLPFYWVSGQVLLWAVFQLLCVPCILQEKLFSTVVAYFNLFTALLLGISALLLLCDFFTRKQKTQAAREKSLLCPSYHKSYYALWVIFVLLLVFQLIMAVFWAYEEGDDAFYVAISTITVDSDTMYTKLPYTGGSTGLDARHGLAPFPIWIAYLAKLSGMPAVTVAQIAAPLSLILMAYGLYYLLGRKLLSERLHTLPFFMILTEIMVIFGGYSVYSAENFLLVRTAQGKAVMANIILLLIMLLLVVLLNKIHNKEKITISYWILLASAVLAGCLCSTLGTVLTCMLLGVTGICTTICYRKWKILFPLAACCVLPICYALLYLFSE